MESFLKTIQALLGSKTSSAIPVSPNTFADIIKQLEAPVVKEEKSPLQVFQDVFYKESMSKLEVEMLKMEPHTKYTGYQYWFDSGGNKFCDWVPCMIRPEVEYCCYGKN